MYVAAVDPGLNRSGVALFNDDRQLIYADTVTATKALVGADPGTRVVWMSRMIVRFLEARARYRDFHLVTELPQIYQRPKSKGDPNTTLIPLAAICGGVAVGSKNACTSTFIHPHEWKGQIPKTRRGENYIIEGRVRAELSDDEYSCIPPKMPHDGWDAIGIGLHHLGRWGKKIYPGASPG